MRYFFISSGDERSNDVRSWVNIITGGTIRGKLPFKFVKKITKGLDAVVVSGGDGTILHAIEKYSEFNMPFIGFNRGTWGYLLNPIDSFDEFFTILADLKKHKIVELNLLKATFVNSFGKKFVTHAFNEAYVKESIGNKTITGTVTSLSPENGFTKFFQGDGIVVSTPQGSTAYNKASFGHILHLSDKLFAVTTICPTREHIKEATTWHRVEVEVERGKATGFAGSSIIKDVKKMVVEPSVKKVKLIFIDGYNYELKRFKQKSNTER